MYEHNALGYWLGLALCLTKVRSSRARCPATALISNKIFNFRVEKILFIAWVCFPNVNILFRLTCVYLACKVDEFNVSIAQFVGNLKGDREKFANIILGFELLLMDKLHYHLTVHNPFRPLEGIFIDIKVCTLGKLVREINTLLYPTFI